MHFGSHHGHACACRMDNKIIPILNVYASQFKVYLGGTELGQKKQDMSILVQGLTVLPLLACRGTGICVTDLGYIVMSTVIYLHCHVHCSYSAPRGRSFNVFVIVCLSFSLLLYQFLIVFLSMRKEISTI